MKKLFVLSCALLLASVALAEKTFYDPYDGKAPFSAAVRVGDLLFLSGVLGTKDGQLADGGTGPETARALEIIGERLAEYELTTADVVKCTVFLADIADFSEMNAEYMQVFQPPRPARSALAASGLALNANVEIECIAAY
ncbi:MAG: RidA family protein [Pseudomonadota bacterium]